MNLGPSDIPRLAGAAKLSKPGFDIILAVSSARQAAQPTVRLLTARTNRDSLDIIPEARRALFAGRDDLARHIQPHSARFFDLSGDLNALPETMNSPFTRGFQPMLSPSPLDQSPSVEPIHLDDENME